MAEFFPVAQLDEWFFYSNTTMITGTVRLGKFDGDSCNIYLRFPGITIPQGSRISSALLTLYSAAAKSGTVCTVDITANDVDDAVSPGSNPSYYSNYNNLTLTTALVQWSNIPAQTVHSEFTSPELKTIIQEIVDRVGWASGNALALCIKNNGSNYSAYRDACTTESGDGSQYIPKLTITFTDFTGEISETVSFSDTNLNSFNNTERMEEGLTLADVSGGGFEFLGDISEDLTFNEALSFLYAIIGNVQENLTLSESLSNEEIMSLTEGLTLAEVLQCPYWFESISENINLLQRSLVENKNVTWREERSINMVGEHIQLTFKNAEVEQGLYLRDIKMYFDRWEDRKAIEAGDYVGEHIRFKIQNKVVDESLYLEYIRIIGIFRGLLGWSV